MAVILITGGAGFIGSNIVDEALAAGHSVRVLDNLSTGKRDNIHPKAIFFQGDITNFRNVEDAIKGTEYVLHLAAQASVVLSTRDPQLDCAVNVIGTLNVLKASLENKVRHVIFLSTGGAIYGDVKTLPASEDTAKRPLSPYGTSKAAAELYCEYYSRLGLPVSILRLANVYGPRQDPLGEAGVCAIFLGNILAKKPLTVFGDGSSTRDYVYVKDVAELVLMTMDRPLREPINVGTGEETSVNRLIEAILKITSERPRIVYTDPRPGEVQRIRLEIAKARALGWKPKTSLEQGLRAIWLSMRST